MLLRLKPSPHWPQFPHMLSKRMDTSRPKGASHPQPVA